MRWWESKHKYNHHERAAIAALRPILGGIIARMAVRRLRRNKIHVVKRP